MKKNTTNRNTAKKAAAAAAVLGHAVFCLYQSLFCFYNGSRFVNDLLYKISKKLCFAVFEVSEDMLLTVAPWWLLGMACTAAVIVIMFRKKAARYAVPVCITFAAAVFLAVICGNGYYFSDLPYGPIYTVSGFWFLLDTVFVLAYFTKQKKKKTPAAN
jgi:hypothetical protein